MPCRHWKYTLPEEPRERSKVGSVARTAWGEWAELMLPKGVAMEMHIVLGEAVSNVIRHSGSRVMEVLCLATDRATVLDVIDTGRGFITAHVPEPDLTSDSGRGLWIMRHIASVFIVSRPGLTIVSSRKEW